MLVIDRYPPFTATIEEEGDAELGSRKLPDDSAEIISILTLSATRRKQILVAMSIACIGGFTGELTAIGWLRWTCIALSGVVILSSLALLLHKQHVEFYKVSAIASAKGFSEITRTMRFYKLK